MKHIDIRLMSPVGEPSADKIGSVYNFNNYWFVIERRATLDVVCDVALIPALVKGVAEALGFKTFSYDFTE